MKDNIFVTAINCIDGRAQKPVIKFLTNRFEVDYVDMVTIPGADKVLSQNTDEAIVTSIRNSVEISITKHNSKIIAIVGHHDCAANPVDIKEHMDQIKKSIENVAAWELKASILGLWIDQNWNVNELA